jgi:hypothetical protein
MPRYFFNVHHGKESFVDEVGEDLTDDYAAWQEATSSAGESIRDLDGRLQPGMDWRLEVATGERGLLYVIEVKAHQQTATAEPVSSFAQRRAARRPRR